MNNKGFTLIELIVVISLVLIFATIFTVNMTRNLQNQNEDNEQKMISDLEVAADAYIHSNPTLLKSINTTKTKILTSELVNKGFLRTDEGYLTCIYVNKDSTTGLLVFSKGTC